MLLCAAPTVPSQKHEPVQATPESKAANVAAGEVSRQVQHVVDSALPLLLKAFDTDDDKEAVTAAVLGCGVILTGAGAQSCQKYMEAMATGSSMVRQHWQRNRLCLSA